MKIAICFYGLTRSLKYTIDSIEENIFKPLKDANIEYDIYLHTYYFEGNYNNVFGNEHNIQLDFNEYKLLNPDYFKQDDQNEVIKKIDFAKFGKNHYKKQTHNNAILGLYSLREATKMIEKGFDFVTIASDQRLLTAGSKDILENIKGSLSKKDDNATY